MSLPLLSLVVAGSGSSASAENLGRELPLGDVAQWDASADPRARNSQMDAVSSDWVLFLSDREEVGLALALEIAQRLSEPRAWAYRFRIEETYCGRPLRLGERPRGEIRLLHRRHARFDARAPEGVKVQGTVVRMENALQHPRYRSTAEHRMALAASAVPHSLLRQILLFTVRVARSGAFLRGGSTLRFLWIEAGFDRSQ